jgi:hypothetical protein
MDAVRHDFPAGRAWLFGVLPVRRKRAMSAACFKEMDMARANPLNRRKIAAGRTILLRSVLR